jgi:17beta-estradiol 17-dehydrogenase / very-long-chain 3-oxoacyl-CoA reductase
LIRKYPAKENSQRPWALITGASDGIGAEYSRQLAREGFNICLVSRTLSKMRAVVDDIKMSSPEATTKVIVADFSAPDATSPDFFKNILSQTQDLDISIVIANAGLLTIGKLKTIPKF